jgi:DNA polymerase-3 subunit gamma/tau
VKFVFATTEIRKVPVTVLSRCQRFDLRRVPLVDLSAHFGRIAAKESAAIAQEALDLIARAADGSVRDGLSLLDQAIAQSDGAPITAAAVADMLGLADRADVFDLLEAVMRGDPATALAITERAHEHGADPGVLLQDLLDLLHTLSRLKVNPALGESRSLPEIERARGAPLAGKLAVPVIGRAWQMLLKGIGEVEAAPDRRAAADMVLIRLCHVADLPTPGELVRSLTASPPQTGGTPPSPPSPPSPPPGGGVRAVASGGAMAAPAQPAPVADSAPRLANFRDVAALVATRQEPILHGHLVHSVHLVRFAPGLIELRPQPEAPRDLAPRLAAMLLEATGTRWTIALSTAEGEPTLAEQRHAADAGRRANAADHPLVQAILAAFPGAAIEAVEDSRVDAYGLAPPPDLPEFAPLDAELADDDAPWETDA